MAIYLKDVVQSIALVDAEPSAQSKAVLSLTRHDYCSTVMMPAADNLADGLSARLVM